MEPHRPPEDPAAIRNIRSHGTTGAGGVRGKRQMREKHEKRGEEKARCVEPPLDTDWLEHEALRYVARGETTQFAVRQLLERKIDARCDRTGEDGSHARDAISDVLAGLVRHRYVDDERFAAQLHTRLVRQGRSAAEIRYRLESKGVPAEIIRESLADHSEASDLEAAWQVARRRRLGPYCLDPETRAANRERHLSIFGRAGFSREVAHEVIDAISVPPASSPPTQTPESDSDEQDRG